MSAQPIRPVVTRWVEGLLAELGGTAAGSVRVAGAANGLACLVVVWPADQRMPTARRAKGGGRGQCRADVLAVVRAAGGPLTRKEVVRAVRGAGLGHGPGTVAKALADLTAAGALLNPRDNRGYRLPEWVRPHPTLFPEG